MNANSKRLRQMRHNAARASKRRGQLQHWREFGQHMHPQDCSGQKKFTLWEE